jgi:penicillin amidase
MVVSLEKSGIKTWATYPGGQSGNPGSVHYDDMLERWTKGQYFRLMFLQKPEDGAGHVLYSTQFNPDSK